MGNIIGTINHSINLEPILVITLCICVLICLTTICCYVSYACTHRCLKRRDRGHIHLVYQPSITDPNDSLRKSQASSPAPPIPSVQNAVNESSSSSFSKTTTSKPRSDSSGGSVTKIVVTGPPLPVAVVQPGPQQPAKPQSQLAAPSAAPQPAPQPTTPPLMLQKSPRPTSSSKIAAGPLLQNKQRSPMHMKRYSTSKRRRSPGPPIQKSSLHDNKPILMDKVSITGEMFTPAQMAEKKEIVLFKTPSYTE